MSYTAYTMRACVWQPLRWVSNVCSGFGCACGAHSLQHALASGISTDALAMRPLLSQQRTYIIVKFMSAGRLSCARLCQVRVTLYNNEHVPIIWSYHDLMLLGSNSKESKLILGVVLCWRGR